MFFTLPSKLPTAGAGWIDAQQEVPSSHIDVTVKLSVIKGLLIPDANKKLVVPANTKHVRDLSALFKEMDGVDLDCVEHVLLGNVSEYAFNGLLVLMRLNAVNSIVEQESSHRKLNWAKFMANKPTSVSADLLTFPLEKRLAILKNTGQDLGLALSEAISTLNRPFIEALIRMGEPLNATDKDQWNALHAICQASSDLSFDALIEKILWVCSKDVLLLGQAGLSGQTPLEVSGVHQTRLANELVPRLEEIVEDDSESQERQDTANNMLGILHSKGIFVDQDAKKAFEYFELAAEDENSPHADLMLGLAYRDGLGVKKNMDDAIEKIEGAMIEGVGAAYLARGVMYKDRLGRVTLTELQAATQCFVEASKLGVAAAYYELGALAERRLYNLDNAQNLYLKGAKRGHRLCAFKVGVYYLEKVRTSIQGKAITKTEAAKSKEGKAALSWLKFAKEGGIQDAAAMLVKLQAEWKFASA